MIDEYYCPHCGAILNDQDGFDPNNSTWTCTECGQDLYGDDVYDGDTYPGVMWYCDGCGDLLNKQEGFTDVYSTYTCKKCGYLNTIDSSNIDNYEDNDSLEKADENETIGEKLVGAFFEGVSQGINEYFDKSNETNNSIGQDNDLLYPDVTWYCDECNSILNEQDGFTDREGTWECTECGHINDINEDEIDNNNDGGDDYCYSSDSSDDNSFEDNSYNYSYSPPTEDVKPKEKGKIAKFFDSVLKTIRIIFIITAVIFLAFMGWKIYNKYYNPETHPGQIKLQSSQSSYKNQDYMVVYREFKNAGFKNVKLEPIKDIVLGWFAKEGEVEEVTIDDGGFKSGEWISENARITIKYHIKKD